MYESVNAEQNGQNWHWIFQFSAIFRITETNRASITSKSHLPTKVSMTYLAYCTVQRLPWSMAHYATQKDFMKSLFLSWLLLIWEHTSHMVHLVKYFEKIHVYVNKYCRAEHTVMSTILFCNHVWRPQNFTASLCRRFCYIFLWNYFGLLFGLPCYITTRQ